MPTWPKPTEVAILKVNGQNFQDWESVLVRHSLWETPWFHARFTCSEGMPLAKAWSTLQIKPGDACEISLGGQPAFRGMVETRQVFYDAHRHYIEIQCASGVDVLVTSVISKTMEWKNNTFEQIARSVLGKIEKNLSVVGGSLPQIKFPRISAMHGDSIHDFLDTLARGLSAATGLGIAFTTNLGEDFVVAVGPEGQGGDFVEGFNILEGREIIYNASMKGIWPVISQDSGTDKDHATKVSSEPYNRVEYGENWGKKFASTLVSDLPTINQNLLKGRGHSERGWLQGDQITVFITVLGWLRPGGDLWRHNQTYTVRSPMLIMQGSEKLRAKSVTFTQDNRTGTRTVLELCNDLALGPTTPPIT